MEENLKQLLLKDLCARLPYGVKVTWDGKHPLTVTPHIYCAIVSENNINNLPKLLLRPMSSMTEEEDEKRIRLGIWRSAQTDDWEVVGITCDYRSSQGFQNALKFLLENHFDIFGLIPKGLAIEVTEKNNPYKQ